MRQITELLKNPPALHAAVLEYSRKYRSLLAPSAEVLADTVIILRSIVSISAKVLPIKSYFLLTQEIQRTAFLAERLAVEVAKDELPNNVSQEDRLAKIARLKLEYQKEHIVTLMARLKADYERRQGGLVEYDVDSFQQHMEQNAHRQLATEDVFMLACSFLQVSVAKQGSVYYLAGESPMLKETKRKRVPVNMENENTIKDLASWLGRSDDNRGEVERNGLLSGFNYLQKYNRMALQAPDVAAFMKRPIDNLGNMPKDHDVMAHFGLNALELDRVKSMARRFGYLEDRVTRKDPDNKYELRANNHKRVIEYAKQLGMTPAMALNRVLDTFFVGLEIEKRKKRVTNAPESAEAKPSRPARSKVGV